MSTSTIVLLVAIVIVAFLIIRFVAHNLIKISVTVLLLGAGAYFLFYWNGGIVNLGKDNFILYEMQEAYCIEKADTAICECVVMVLLEDIQEQYTPEEILELSGNRGKSIEVVMQSFNDNREFITACMRENDPDFDAEKLKEGIKELELGSKLKELFDKLEQI